jgi:hypothetical protein
MSRIWVSPAREGNGVGYASLRFRAGRPKQQAGGLYHPGQNSGARRGRLVCVGGPMIGTS